MVGELWGWLKEGHSGWGVRVGEGGSYSRGLEGRTCVEQCGWHRTMPRACVRNDECCLEQDGVCVRELGELTLSRKTERESGLSSLSHGDPLEQGVDLAKASLRSLSWQPRPGRSQPSLQVAVGGVQM